MFESYQKPFTSFSVARSLTAVGFLGVLLAFAPPAWSWGGAGHKLVSELALRDLPPEVAAWFKGQEEVFRDHSSDPDFWRHDRKEGPRHFIDTEEAYGGPGSVPCDVQEAIARVGAATFQGVGRCPGSFRTVCGIWRMNSKGETRRGSP